MQMAVYIAALLILLWILAVWPGPSRRQRLEPFERRLIAHRGLHSNKEPAPENSLAAFALAADAGYGIELDVRETADGGIVVCHDDSLRRMAYLDAKVSSMKLEEVRQVRLLKTKEKIPTLREALDLIAGRVPVIVEIKCESTRRAASVCALAAAELDRYNGIYAVQSFNPAVVWWYRRHRGEVLRGQLSERFAKEKFPTSVGTFFLSCCFFNFITRPDYISYRFSNARLLRFRLQKDLFHVPCAGWTIRSEEQLAAAVPDFEIIIFDRFRPGSGGGTSDAAGGGRMAARSGAMIRKHMLISGRVTGVGLRFRAVSIAEAMGLTGYVRNVDDDTVEMEIQGRSDEIALLIERLRSSKWIDITEIEERDMAPLPDDYGFRVRY